MRCLATCSTKRKPLFLNTNDSVTGLSGLQWTDKYLHLANADTNTITDSLRTFSTYSDKKVTVFWKSKKESLRDLHEFRRQNTFTTVELPQNEYAFKPVKNRPPTPVTLLNLRELVELVPSPSPLPYQNLTPPSVSPSGYFSSSYSSTESTTTTTTTVKMSWNNPTNYHSSSSSRDDTPHFY
jgi:hypothetical protein